VASCLHLIFIFQIDFFPPAAYVKLLKGDIKFPINFPPAQRRCDMDIVSMAAALTGFLSPVLPYLLKGGEGAAKEVGKKFGGAAWEKAKDLWAKLQPRFESRPAAQEAVQAVAQVPEDQAAQGALNLQVRKILVEDNNLAQELASWLVEAEQAGVRITVASGDRSVAIGGEVTGSSIITGDRNR
jgi:hypothetical protein